MTYSLGFLAYFVIVTLKAYQQRQVMAAEYWKMPPVSYAMAACDVFLMSLVARTGSITALVLLAIAMGTGSSLGSMLGTWLHARKH